MNAIANSRQLGVAAAASNDEGNIMDTTPSSNNGNVAEKNGHGTNPNDFDGDSSISPRKSASPANSNTNGTTNSNTNGITNASQGPSHHKNRFLNYQLQNQFAYYGSPLLVPNQCSSNNNSNNNSNNSNPSKDGISPRDDGVKDGECSKINISPNNAIKWGIGTLNNGRLSIPTAFLHPSPKKRSSPQSFSKITQSKTSLEDDNHLSIIDDCNNCNTSNDVKESSTKYYDEHQTLSQAPSPTGNTSTPTTTSSKNEARTAIIATTEVQSNSNQTQTTIHSINNESEVETIIDSDYDCDSKFNGINTNITHDSYNGYNHTNATNSTDHKSETNKIHQSLPSSTSASTNQLSAHSNSDQITSLNNSVFLHQDKSVQDEQLQKPIHNMDLSPSNGSIGSETDCASSLSTQSPNNDNNNNNCHLISPLPTPKPSIDTHDKKNDTATTAPISTTTTKKKTNKRRISFDEQNILDTSTPSAHKYNIMLDTKTCNEDGVGMRSSISSISDNDEYCHEEQGGTNYQCKKENPTSKTIHENFGQVNPSKTSSRSNTNDSNKDKCCHQQNQNTNSSFSLDKIPGSFLKDDYEGIMLPDLTVTKTGETSNDEQTLKDYIPTDELDDQERRSSVSLTMDNSLEEEDHLANLDARQMFQDSEDSSSIASLDDSTICLPMPYFIHRLLSAKNKRRRLNSVEDVAKKITSEHVTRKEKIERDDYIGDYEEKIKEIWVGDIGLALFIPFDFDAFDEHTSKANIDLIAKDSLLDDHDDHFDSDLSLSADECDCSDSALSECSLDEIVIDYDSDEEPVPNILSIEQMREINRRALPPSVQLMTWKRVYSVRRDGDYFGTMFDRCCFYKHTLVVIKTTNGDILGGYADTPWGEQKKSGSLQRSLSFFGGGRSFLFATAPDLTDEEMQKELKARRSSRDNMYFYNWTGENNFSQICDNERGSLGMGGGGEFGFFLQRDFTIGSTGRCSTFGNPPLTKSDGGNFEILDLEVYGFSSMSARMSPNPSRHSMSYSSFGSIGKHSMHSHSSFGGHSSFSSPTSSVVSILE